MTTAKTLDLVTLEVIRNGLPAITNEMSFALQRTSYNMMIYEVRDYCCGLLGPNGDLLSQNTGGVSHFVADLGVVIRDGVERYGRDGFKPGDVIITNHQRVAGQHLNNVVVYTPFCFDGELLAFPVIRAHWVDVGGMSTGFGAGNAVDPWMEGFQLDQIKLYDEGKLDEKVWHILRDNIRFPESSLGDLKAQIAACRLAERRLEELLKRYGRDVVLEAIQRIFDQTEARCRAVVQGFKDGVFEAESLFLGNPLDNNEPLKIKVKVTVEGSDMTIDLTGCSPERRAPVNARSLAGAYVAFKGITLPFDPVNEGSFRPLKVVIQEGNYMMARYPAPMASWGRTIPSVVDTILRALAPVIPEKIPRITWECSAAPWSSSARTPGQAKGSSPRASKAAGGEDGPGRTANPHRSPSVRATCAMHPSRKWSCAGPCWYSAGPCARIPADRANSGAGSASRRA